MSIAGEAYQFFEQRVTAAGLDRALKAQALADTTGMVLRRGIDRQKAADLVEQFALRCDFDGVDVRAEIAKGLDAAEIKQSQTAANGRSSHAAQLEPDVGAPNDFDDELQDDLEPRRNPILVSYARKIAIADKDRKLNAWRRCCAEAADAIRKGLIDYSVASDELLELADSHGLFALSSREKAEAEECWRSLPHEADGKRDAPTPYRCRNPASIPRRAWLFGRHYIRRFVTTTVAAGGVGKTSLALAEVISMVTSRDFLGARPESDGLRVWYWNGEDPQEEIERRIAAICQHHNIDMQELEASRRLFFDSGHDTPIKFAMPAGTGKVSFNENLITWFKRRITDNCIDVVVLDPFISCHGVTENDNAAIDQVVKRLAQIAVECDAAVEIPHHVRKAVRGQAELTADDARGGSAIVNACRSARVLNRMKPIEAEAAGIKGEKAHRCYVRIDRDKANMAPADAAKWVRLVDVPLANGDHVGAIETWEYPKPFDSVTAADMRAVREAARRAEQAGTPYMLAPQAKERWIGAAVAERLELDVTNTGHCKRISALIKTWRQNGVLKVEERRDPQHRNKRNVVIPGNWNEPASITDLHADLYPDGDDD
jgi:hypothetical protein